MKKLSNEKLLDIKRQRRHKFNRKVLALVLIVVVATFTSKLIEGVLIDIGYGVSGKINLGWWKDPEILNSSDAHVVFLLNTRPHLFWIFTQFTWLTTLLFLIFLVFRFFEYSDNVPGWLRWFTSPRSATLIAAYELIVGIVFWSALITNFYGDFSPHMFYLQFSNTILVHGIIPVLALFIAILQQTKSERASLFREKYIINGMIFPVIYFLYYIVVSYAWTDPYPLTDFKNNFLISFLVLAGSIIGIYILLGTLMIMQNAILLKYNKSYDPSNDYASLRKRKYELEKARDQARRKFLRKYPEIVEHEKEELKRAIEELSNKKED